MKYAVYLFLFFQVIFGYSQTATETQQNLADLGERTIMAITEHNRLEANHAFTELLENTIGQYPKGNFDYSGVKNLSVQISQDKAVGLYTWVVPLKTGSYRHFGFLVTHQKEGTKIISLEDKSLDQDDPEHVWGKTSNWYGAIYYDIKEFKDKKNKYYVLFGYRPGNTRTQQKLLEVITLDGEKLRFGAKIFNTPNIQDKKHKKRPYRLIFEYNKKVVAMLKYSKSEKMIVMDHLSPPDASMQRMWQFYGPDFSYDGLKWEKGKFELVKEINLKSNVTPTQAQEKPKQGL